MNTSTTCFRLRHVWMAAAFLGAVQLHGQNFTDRPLTGNVNANFGIGQPSAPNMPTVSAGSPTAPEGYTVVDRIGNVETRTDDNRSTLVQPGSTIPFGNSIYVPAGGRLVLRNRAGDTITLGEFTDGKLTSSGVSQKDGDVGVSTNDQAQRPPETSTPTATSRPTGTKFRSHFDRQKQANRITVEQGHVLVTPKNANLSPRTLAAGQTVTVYHDRMDPPDAGQAADASKLRGLSIERRVVRAGAMLTIPVLLNNLKTDAAAGLGNINFEITYNPNVLAVSGNVSRGNIYGSGTLFEANARQTGRIRIGFASERGVTQSGTVAQIPFRVLGQPGQSTELTLNIIQCQTPSGQAASLRTSNGSVTIPAPITERSAQEPGVYSVPGGGRGGLQSLIPPTFRNPDGTAKGDSDGDQRLTAKDAEAALQMSVGNRPVDNNLDVDKDGKVMSADARRILQEASRMIGAENRQ
ncbi:MAG: hypothetical protein HZC54_19250 [Verrucomicrobia bacterium]|nr:hypothetical protein [Verrucomicrobiota bacterium]